MGRPAAKKQKKRSSLTAKTADRHKLYQMAVQDPAGDVEFFRQAWADIHGEDGPAPLHLREDFCGTFLLASHWVEQGEEFTAEVVDNEASVLDWGRKENLSRLSPADQQRVDIVEDDARCAPRKPADIRCAHNFSYSIFHEREELLGYLKTAREGLVDGGIFVLDLFGGTEAVQPVEEKREQDEGFHYIWDQAEYHPGTGRILCKIHFRFYDGSQIRNAFTYDWRLWGMPELKDLLREAGFRDCWSYFEEIDDDEGEGTGEYMRDENGWAAETWLAYLVAQR